MISYYPTVPKSSNKIQVRLEMVRYAEKFGISAAARVFGTTRVTVRKWVRRFDGTLGSLEDASRAPKRRPNKLSPEDERMIIELREKFPRWGANRLKAQFGLEFSTKTIYRVLREAGLLKKRKRKRVRKKECRWKGGLVPFELVQVDTKDLSDIPEFWRLRKELGLPRWQFSFRDVATGLVFFGYSEERSNFAASNFVEYVLLHLREFGIDLRLITVQTDNGTEFVMPARSTRRSRFEQTLARYGVKHRLIPPGCPTYNSDVESFHRIVEDEFYCAENFVDRADFYGKAICYQAYFNILRKNRGRCGKTPLELLRAHYPDAPAHIAALPPVDVSPIIQLPTPGYHVGKAVKKLSFSP